MKYKQGNIPNCWQCKYYKEQTINGEMKEICINKYNRTHGMNHKIIEEKPYINTKGTLECKEWIEKETGITYFEAVCSTIGPWRTKEEIEYLKTLPIKWRK